MSKHETAEMAFQRIATRNKDHPLEKIGRQVFLPLTDDQWVEVLAAICKNNIDHDKRVPDITYPMKAVVQDDAEIFPLVISRQVPSGGTLLITPTQGGFECKWKE